jgi:hypothetical protein
LGGFLPVGSASRFNVVSGIAVTDEYVLTKPGKVSWMAYAGYAWTIAD